MRMNDRDFENYLAELYREPATARDGERLAASVLRRIEREALQRRALLIGASCLGVGLAVAVVLMLQPRRLAQPVLAQLSVVLESLPTLTMPDIVPTNSWILAAVSLAIMAAAALRAARQL
jgi:hypothetical protein